MSDLDKKLEEVLYNDQMSIEDERGSGNHEEALKATYELIGAIKKIFVGEVEPFIREAPYRDEDFDSGWNNAIYAMQDQFGDEEEYPKDNPISMTGQEWYDKFMNEAGLSEEFSHPFIDAAKRTAGIE